jgi:hypothetical protein
MDYLNKGLSSAMLGQLFDVPEPVTAEDLLKSELAKGEISEAEFRERMDLLNSSVGQSETTAASSSQGRPNGPYFAHTEGAVRKHPFQTFFTTGEPVNFET